MTTRFLALAHALAVASCGPHEQPPRPATPECLLGVWQQIFLSEDGTSAVCPMCESNPPSATVECEQPDCAEAYVWAFSEEASVWGRWRWSETLGSMTIRGRCPLAQRPWRIDEPGLLVRLTPDPERNTMTEVACAPSRLVVGGEEYTRAPDGFAASVLRMIAIDECTRAYAPP